MAYYIQMKNPTTGIEEIIPEMVLDFGKRFPLIVRSLGICGGW